MSIVNQLLEIAKSKIKDLKSGELFLVRDLFKGYEWNRISRSERLLLSTLFLNFAKTDLHTVTVIEKNIFWITKVPRKLRGKILC